MQSGFRAHRRVSLLPPLFSLLSKRRKNLYRLRRPLRMDRRRSRALFCVFPFCREARFFLLHTTTIRHKASFSLSWPRCARSPVRFPGLRVPLSRPAPFSPATLYLHPSRLPLFQGVLVLPSSGPIFFSLSPAPSITLLVLYSFHSCDRPACAYTG